MTVEADDKILERWPKLPDAIRQALGTRDDIDTCSHIELSMHQGSMKVDVALMDGRSTSRRVSSRDDLLGTLEALLLVPRYPSGSAGTPAPSESQNALVVAPGSGEPPVAATTEAPKEPKEPSDSTVPVKVGELGVDRTLPRVGRKGGLRVEFAVTTSAQVGDGETSLGLGVDSFLDIGGWLLVFGGSIKNYHAIDGDFSAPALELAMLGGRRFRFGSLALDLIAGPGLALRANSGSAYVGRASGDTGALQQGTKENRGLAPRVLTRALLNFWAFSTVRPFLGVDGEFGPSYGNSVNNFPDWTVGLEVGATLGAL